MMSEAGSRKPEAGNERISRYHRLNDPALVARAREMASSGYGVRQIVDELGIAWNTAKAWIDPAYAERRRVYMRRSHEKARDQLSAAKADAPARATADVSPERVRRPLKAPADFLLDRMVRDALARGYTRPLAIAGLVRAPYRAVEQALARLRKPEAGNQKSKGR